MVMNNNRGIDYSKCVIYKISCKDENIHDCYIGHSANYVYRLYSHKNSCNNDKCIDYNKKLYKFIRANGGWKNWTMEILEYYPCKNLTQARKMEQNYIEGYNSTLNELIAYKY